MRDGRGLAPTTDGLGNLPSKATGVLQGRVSFVSSQRVAAQPETWLARALHGQLDGSRRGLCVVDRLARAIRHGDVRCDGVRIGWVPPQAQLAVYSDSQWRGRTASEGHTHRNLRAIAALYLAAAVPNCRLYLPSAWTAARHRRADLLASDGIRKPIATELGAVDADSIYLQLARLGMGHVLTLPYAGVLGESVSCYVFRGSLEQPLPSPTQAKLRDTWLLLLAEALRAATYAPGP